MIETVPPSTTSSFGGSPSAAPQQTADRLTELLNDADLQELAAKLAMNGLPLDHGLQQLESAKRVRVNALEEECRSRKAVLKKWIDELMDSTDHIREQLTKLTEERENLKQSKFNVDVAIRMIQLKKATIRLEIRVRQLEAEKQFFIQEGNNLAEKETAVRQRILDSRQDELEYAKNLHRSLLDVWNIDEAELRRRADVLKAEYEDTESVVGNIAAKISELRNLGLTRTTAGFLIWVGYTAFAGVGGLIGVLLQQRQSDPKSADLIGNIIRGVGTFFGLVPGTTFAWSSFLRFLAFTGIVLLLTLGITLACDVVLRRIHPRWRRSSFDRQPQKRPSHAGGWKDVTAVFLSGSDRLSLFTGQITRRDYLQLLAVTPYLAIAALVVFLISALGITLPTSTSGTGLSAGATLTSASLGAVFTLISTSACLLYATKVIEPRWQARAQSGHSGSSRFAFIRAGWEFALLMLFMITVLLLLTFLPLNEGFNYWALGLTAFFRLAARLVSPTVLYAGVFSATMTC